MSKKVDTPSGKGKRGGLTPRERQEAKRALALEEFAQQVANGKLVIRTMTDEERTMRRVCICHQRVLKVHGRHKAAQAKANCPLHGTGIAARAVGRGTA